MTGAWITIQRDADHQVRRWFDEHFDVDGLGEFMWLDGNYSCDCNRGLFFARAAGEPDNDVPCGMGAYTALAAYCLDGRVIGLDDPDAIGTAA